MTSPAQYMLKLYITNMTPKIQSGVGSLLRSCDQSLKGRYELRIVNILENPQLAEGDRVLATPTLIRMEPPPSKRVIGDISNTDKVMTGLELNKKRY